MFIDENDLDDGFNKEREIPKYSLAQSKAPTGGMATLNLEDDNDGLPPFGSAGGLGTPSSSRARMLAQQREIQLKKRQNNMLGGMVRSSIESNVSSSSPKPAQSSQFTPAVRQFSAPKSVRDSSNDASPEKNSEFDRRGGPKSNQPPSRGIASTENGRRNERFSDDEDDDPRYRRAEQRMRDRERQNNDRDRGHRRSSGGRSRNNYEDDDDEDDDDYYDRRYQRRNERDDREDRRDRGGSKSRGYDNRRDYDDRSPPNRGRDDDYYRDDRRGSGGGKWTGASGGREVNQNYHNNNRDPRERDYFQQNDHQDNRYNTDDRYNSNYNNRGDPSAVPAASPARSITAHAQHEYAGSPINKGAPPGSPGGPPIVPPDLSDMRRFLTTPLPRECGIVQCYIRRNKSGTNKLFPVYSLFLKEGDVFLMASKKRPKNKTSNYLISADQHDLSRTGRGYLGKLRSNFVGTEFQVFDDGVNPKDTDPDEVASNKAGGAVRCEMAAVMYAANVLGSRGPRKMQVALPGLDGDGNIIRWKDGGEGGHGSEDILTRMRDRNMRDLNYLINKPPRWNEQVGAYVLNFNGRVTMASVKNFQLVDPDEQNAVVLQFGRVGKDEFTMDMQHPICPFQAFAVTLSSFDSKIACD